MTKVILRYIRRFQANLQYLAADAERATKPADKMPQGPAIVTPPAILSPEQSSAPATQQLAALYSKLQQLFPDWRGATKTPQNHASGSQASIGQAAQPNPNPAGAGIAAAAS